MSEVVLNRDFVLRQMEIRHLRSVSELARQSGLSSFLVHHLFAGTRKLRQKSVSLRLSFFDAPFGEGFEHVRVLTKVNEWA